MSQIKERPRIIMVDDEVDFLELTARWLRTDYEVVTFGSGEGVMAQIEDLDPDLIVLDVHMPTLDGFELCRRIRAESRYDETPILFLTGSREDESYLKNLKAGGTSFLTKPIGRKQLQNAIRELLPAPDDDHTTGGGD